MKKTRNQSSQLKEATMLNEVYDTMEAILESLDAGGEQSLAFAEEIKMLKEVLGYPEPAEDALAETLRRCQIARKLERLAVQAEDLTVTLPTLPVAQWLDGTFQDAKVEVLFEKCDLARLLQFIADYGVSEQS
jgi:ABC-type phosphate transport system ATPase subunit